MDTYRTLLVDAFAAEPLAGVAAGVVPDATGLDAERMAAVARELGAPGTAFVFPGEDAARRLRLFTPDGEVDRCDHAVVAAHAHLREAGVVEEGSQAVEMPGGTLDVEIEDGLVWVEREVSEARGVSLDYDQAGAALGIDPAALRDVGADLPPAVAATDPSYLLVPVNFLEHLSGADPDADALATLADEHDAAGVYAFTFDALDADSTLHARCFAPGRGVNEEPVTAAAAGACAAYLRRAGAFTDGEGDPPDEIRVEQGHFVDRPGRVHVSLADGLAIGGRAVTALDGSIVVPTADDDDIIEA